MLNKLKSQLLLLSTLPAIIVTLGLIVYMNVTRMQDFDHYLQQRGENSSSQIAALARTALQRNSTDALQILASNTLEENGVRSVNIYNTEAQLLAHAGPRTHQTKEIRQQLRSITEQKVFNLESSIIFVAAMNSGIYTSDWLGPNNPALKPQKLGWVSVEYNRDRFTLNRYNSLLSQNSVFLLCFIFAAICGVYIQRRFNTDLNQISNTLKQLHDGKPIGQMTHCKSKELDDLYLGIHKLNKLYQAELSELRHSMELATSDLKETIETIEVQNIELGLAQKQAIQASKIKSEFLANTSHEIRTPLNGIIGFAKILKRTALNLQQQEYLDTILLSSDGLLTIINDILDFSKIEAGKLELEPAPCHLRQIYEEVVSLFAPLAYEKQLDINLLFYQDVPNHIYTDAVRLKQVLSNIISNAIKFTHQGEIVIRVALDSDYDPEGHSEQKIAIKTSISDSGIGMTAQQQKGLFQAFSQSNASISREYGGTGLGLAISKKLIEKFEGDISVESSLEKGSTFSFNIWVELQSQKPCDNPATFSNKSIVLISHNVHTGLAIENLLQLWGVKVFSINPDKDIKAQLLDLITHYHIDSMLYAPNPQHNNAAQLTNTQTLAKQFQLSLLALTATPGFYTETRSNKQLTIGYQPITETSLYRSLASHFSTEIEPPAPSMPTNSELSGLDILAVDDNEANLKLLSILLQDLGAHVSTAHDGEQAIQATQEKHFDAIFMDLQMPVINGFEASKHIRQQQDTPIIALTAHALADEKQQLLDIGVNAYLTKPVNEDNLIETLYKVCKLDKQICTLPANTQQDVLSVDIKSCLSLANFKVDLASDMFLMLTQRLSSDIECIRAAFTQQNNDLFIDEVHKLNGACSYTGVPKLKKACMDLETQIKQHTSVSTNDMNILLETLEIEAVAILQWQENNNINTALEQDKKP
ncbi:MAG: response regulator [Pseudomonadales bacterium]|nr:response regulator [Pseudomonadales bacterium]